MDADNAPEITLADDAAPSADQFVTPPRVRWRQRAVGRCRASPAGALDKPRAQVVLPHAGRTAAALAAARAVVDPTAPGASAGVAGVAEDVPPPGPDPRDFDRASRASRARAPGNPGAAGRSDEMVDDGSSRHAAVASGIDAVAGNCSAVDDDWPARRAGDPSQAGPDPEPVSGSVSRPAPEAHDQAVAQGDEPQPAPRDIELWLLARRAQGAALQLDFELRTALARQAFRRDFVYVSRQLHALEASRRVQGLDRARLDDAQATLYQRADAIQSFMGQRATELQAAIDARGPASARIAYARPARLRATIVSPGAHRFLGLLLQADETLARLEMAWLLGLVEATSRSALVSECRRALLGFKDLACDLRHAVGLLVQEVNAQRKEGGVTRDGG